MELPEEKITFSKSRKNNCKRVDAGHTGYVDKEKLFVDLLEKVQPLESDTEFLTEFTTSFLEIVGGQVLSIFLSEKDTEKFFPRMTVGKDPQLMNSFTYKKEGIFREVLDRGTPVQVDVSTNFDDDEFLQKISQMIDFKVAMASSFRSGPDKTGVVMVLGCPDQTGYTDGDLKLLRAFSGIVGMVSRHSSVLDRLEQQSKEIDRKDFDLYIVYQVAKALSSMLDLEELTSMMADLLVEVLTVNQALVFLTSENEEEMQVRASKNIDPRRPRPFETITITEKLPEWLKSKTFEGEIITDFNMPKFREVFPDAAEVLERLEIETIIPMIYKTKLIGFLALGEKYIGKGFHKRDYDFLSTISPLMANAISNAQLYELAILDGLTRVYVNRYFQQRCREEIKRARRYKNVLSIVMWDIDHFKHINDTYGHPMGDRVLREISGLFKKGYREDVDIIARYGGEEFIMLLPDTSTEGAIIMAQRLRKSIAEFPFCDGKLNITISGGIASFPVDGDDYESLVESADFQLYNAKKKGRNRVCWKRKNKKKQTDN
ncbi:MAG: diguanylate cyclase [Vulcanimicrobiota bacterium]